jgi:hypothetical protein
MSKDFSIKSILAPLDDMTAKQLRKAVANYLNTGGPTCSHEDRDALSLAQLDAWRKQKVASLEGGKTE